VSERRLSISVRGREKTWSFNFYADPRFMDEWRADGLDVAEVLNTIPAWWVEFWPAWFPSARVWCFVQDILNFKNPWSEG
jgi:hypothetical protein